MTKLGLKAALPVPETAEPDMQTIEVRGFHTPEAMAAPHRPTEDLGEGSGRRRPLRRNPVFELYASGSLPYWSVQSAQEIARIDERVYGGGEGRVTAAYGEATGGSAHDDDLPVALRVPHAARYLPWRKWASEKRGGPQHTLYELTLLLCLEGRSVGWVSARAHLHHKTVKARLQGSLHWYALNAGWVVEKNR